MSGVKKVKKFLLGALIAATAIVPVAAQPAAASTAVKVTATKPLFDSQGKRVGNVYRVATDGSPQLIIDGKLITVPVSTLSEVEGKLTTSLTKKQITSNR